MNNPKCVVNGVYGQVRKYILYTPPNTLVNISPDVESCTSSGKAYKKGSTVLHIGRNHRLTNHGQVLALAKGGFDVYMRSKRRNRSYNRALYFNFFASASTVIPRDNMRY